MDPVPVVIETRAISVVQIGPKFDFAGGDSRGERNRDGYGIPSQFIHVQLGSGVVGIQGSGSGGRNGERCSGYRCG